MSKKGFRIYRYIIYERNPLGPIMYIVLTVIGAYSAYHLNFHGNIVFIPGPFIPEYHLYTSTLSLIIGYICFFFAFFSEPGIISSQN